MTKTLLLLAGPTASGKSGAAAALALRCNGAIINADAMQVYAGLPVLTAQPTADQQAVAPHALYGFWDPGERFSAGMWLPRARAAVEAAVELGQTPIVVGGTGLYFKALLEGLACVPEVPKAARAKAQALYDALGEQAFRQALAHLDPESAAQLKPNDKQRLIRAYEVAAHTGKPLAHWQRQTQRDGWADRFAVRPCLIMPPRPDLYAACDARFLTMLEQGAMDEVRALAARQLDRDLPAMKILGAAELMAFLQGETDLPTAIAKAQQATRNYAKRQMTWFRNQWKGLPGLCVAPEATRLPPFGP